MSPQFTGKNKVQQQQLVYLALGDRMRFETHALSVRTFAPDVRVKSAAEQLWRNSK